jgi:hypothetical protein
MEPVGSITNRLFDLAGYEMNRKFKADDQKQTLTKISKLTKSFLFDKCQLFWIHKPHNPNYKFMSKRFSSFSDWVKPDVSVIELAEAGLYFDSKCCSLYDNVSCFYCGLELNEWDIDVEPIIEHLRFAPTCAFANLVHLQENFPDNVGEYKHCCELCNINCARIVCLPCGHCSLCFECAKTAQNCANCNSSIMLIKESV